MKSEQLKDNTWYVVCGNCYTIQQVNSIEEGNNHIVLHKAEPNQADHDVRQTQKDVLIQDLYWNLGQLVLGKL